MDRTFEPPLALAFFDSGVVFHSAFTRGAVNWAAKEAVPWSNNLAISVHPDSVQIRDSMFGRPTPTRRQRVAISSPGCSSSTTRHSLYPPRMAVTDGLLDQIRVEVNAVKESVSGDAGQG